MAIILGGLLDDSDQRLGDVLAHLVFDEECYSPVCHLVGFVFKLLVLSTFFALLVHLFELCYLLRILLNALLLPFNCLLVEHFDLRLEILLVLREGLLGLTDHGLEYQSLLVVVRDHLFSLLDLLGQPLSLLGLNKHF